MADFSDVSSVMIREYRAGDPCRAALFYLGVFQDLYQFRDCTEKYFMHAAGEVYDDPEGNMLWVAERDGEVVGTVEIVRIAEHEAQLRLLAVDPSLQGEHLGSRLIETAIDYCIERGYSHVLLWTIDILKPARHLYAKYGFCMTNTKPNDEWADYHMTEEKWEIDLPGRV